jgi:hypothetical protein
MLLILKSKAILRAKNQVIALTKSINQKVGAALYITDFDAILNEFDSNTSGIRIRGMASFKEEKIYEPVNIEFEKIKIETTVRATFKLE